MILRTARWAILAITSSIIASAGTLNFDAIVAPCCYAGITPGGQEGPVVSDRFLTVSGGVVLNESGWGNAATSAPNLYATNDFSPLVDGSFLPGSITGSFSSPVHIFSFAIINGQAQGTFTLTLFSNGQFVGSGTADLASFGNTGSWVDMGAQGVFDSFQVTSNQAAGQIEFAIDTIQYSAVVPEPTTLSLFAAGAAIVCLVRRRKASS